jgi:hypothetical protein
VADVIEFRRDSLHRGSPIQEPGVRRTWVELHLAVTLRGLVLATVAWWGTWTWRPLLDAIPAFVAGDMHNLWKDIGPMCLTGTTVPGLTQTAAPSGPLGRVLAFTLFNSAYHDEAHMPQASLPGFTAVLAPPAPEEQTISPSDWAAFRAMLPTLADPKVGPQWHRSREPWQDTAGITPPVALGR